MCFYIYAMTSDVYCNPVFVIERRQTFTVIKLHHWIAHAQLLMSQISVNWIRAVSNNISYR
jgi:hypothetical protein